MKSERNARWLSLLIVVVGVFILSTGCSTATKKYGSVKINSSPEGAEVINLEDDSNFGLTPVNVSFGGKADTAKYVTIQLRKPGYKDRITSFWVNRRHKTQAEADDNAIDISVELEKR